MTDATLCNYSSDGQQILTSQLAPSIISGGQNQKEPLIVKGNWFRKMLQNTLCILVVILKVFLLGVVLPVSLQQIGGYNGDGENDYPLSPEFEQNGLNAFGQQTNQIDHNGIDRDNPHFEENRSIPPPLEGDDGGDEITTEDPPGDVQDSVGGDDVITVVQNYGEPPPSTNNGNDHNEPESSPPAPCLGTDKLQEKLDSLISSIADIHSSIDKMQSLMQSTVVDERIYKCISAITSGNQTQALKYWGEIIRYRESLAKRTSTLALIIKESYGGDSDHLPPLLEFIKGTKQFQGYSLILQELQNYGKTFGSSDIFTVAFHIKSSCGGNSHAFKSLPQAVQDLLKAHFTLQNKGSKGYLYYAKRCVAKHYFYCLDVLTKTIGTEEMDNLEGEERRRYLWKLNGTEAGGKIYFYILNEDRYWSYRLQDLNNSPRFKLEEAGSPFERECAHFQLQLGPQGEEVRVQIRDSQMWLEGEEYRYGNTTELLLHSWHKTDKDQFSHQGIWWHVKPSEDNPENEDKEEEDLCQLEEGIGAP